MKKFLVVVGIVLTVLVGMGAAQQLVGPSPTATTQATSDSSTKVGTTAWVRAWVAELLAQQGGNSNAWSDPNYVITEPSVPSISAGQSFQSMGNTVWRVTDSTTGGGAVQWTHFYVDRSPFNYGNTKVLLASTGGSLYLQTISANTGAPQGDPIALPAAGGAVDQECQWNPANGDQLFCIVGKTVLKRLNVAAQTWTTVKDFTATVAAVVVGAGDKGLVVSWISSDGDTLWMDYRYQTKDARGICKYVISTNTTSWWPGTALASSSPTYPVGWTFAGSSLDKSGTYSLLQFAGTPINANSALPLERASTLTYRSTVSSNPFAAGTSVSGDFQLNHGTTMLSGHGRAAYDEGSLVTGQTMYEGLADDGNPNWLWTIRKTLLTGSPVVGDNNRLPSTDLFYWKRSSGMDGVHATNNSTGSELIFVSLYQTATTRVTGKPLANEIFMIDPYVTASYDTGTHTITKNGRIRRITHHFSYPSKTGCALSDYQYWAQPHGSSSFDGKFLMFGSSFGQDTCRIDAFIVKLPTLP